ncbi:hypothetical protein CDAR_414981 [Caerostris darwini]|uniref:Uncharacterized protein n=1 Tax=Caerostris darwini TaxID=1538125 RepID=A0AAV4M977_9ARAC|nr:hypothetical protein CDAR_414981 [Caerostris darwini]
MCGGGEWSVMRRWTTCSKVHQERVIRTYGYNVCGNTIERLASPIPPEKQPNLSDEERCARISTVIKKKDIAIISTMHMLQCSIDVLPMKMTLKR